MSGLLQGLIAIGEEFGGMEVFTAEASGVIIEVDLHKTTEVGTRGQISKFFGEGQTEGGKVIVKAKAPERW